VSAVHRVQLHELHDKLREFHCCRGPAAVLSGPLLSLRLLAWLLHALHRVLGGVGAVLSVDMRFRWVRLGGRSVRPVPVVPRWEVRQDGVRRHAADGLLQLQHVWSGILSAPSLQRVSECGLPCLHAKPDGLFHALQLQ